MNREESTVKISSFKVLFHYLNPYKSLVVLRIFSTCLKAGSDVLVSMLVMRLINTVLDGNSQTAYKILAVIISVILLDLFAFFFESYSAILFSSKVSYDMKNKFSKHIVSLPISYIDGKKTGDLVSKLVNNIGAVENYLKGGFLDFIFHALRFSICFIIMIYLNWKLLIICMVIMALATVASNFITNPVTAYNEKLYKIYGSVASVIHDTVNGISIIKSFNLEEIMKDKYQEVNEELVTESLKIDKRNSMINPIKVILNLVPLILCYIIGGYMVIHNTFTVGGLAAFSVMLNYLVEAMVQIPGYISQYRANTGILTNLYDILTINEEHFGTEECITNTEAPAFELHDVSFSYSDGTKILNQLNMEIPNGKKIALVGPSGCGKSTIMKILCGFYPIQEGELKIFGKNIELLDLESVRSNITVVTQDTFLFPGTIAENIAYGKVGASMEEIQKAASMAYAHEFIMKMPEQYETLVGERGVRLSGGEKQRISIARAILKDAPILLMDEPTSSLDTDAELIVQKAINEVMKSKTVIIIAHRLSTIKDVDQILVLNENALIESGTHDELLLMKGFYSKLYHEQKVVNNTEEDLLEDSEIAISKADSVRVREDNEVNNYA